MQGNTISAQFVPGTRLVVFDFAVQHRAVLRICSQALAAQACSLRLARRNQGEKGEIAVQRRPSGGFKPLISRSLLGLAHLEKLLLVHQHRHLLAQS
eukprot:3538460-Rhodomonas_salina.1